MPKINKMNERLLILLLNLVINSRDRQYDNITTTPNQKEKN